jgi:hypothetical protein
LVGGINLTLGLTDELKLLDDFFMFDRIQKEVIGYRKKKTSGFFIADCFTMFPQA